MILRFVLKAHVHRSAKTLKPPSDIGVYQATNTALKWDSYLSQLLCNVLKLDRLPTSVGLHSRCSEPNWTEHGYRL